MRNRADWFAVGTVVCALTACCLTASSARAADQPVPGPPTVIDGPSPDIVSPASLGVSVARDGSGGLVYLKQAGGAAHVFVSRLVGGVFAPPVELDGGLVGSSSQPVIGAGNNGLLVVAFINGGQLYVSEQPRTGGTLSAPVALSGGASNPALSITNFGKAYIAFTTADGSGQDVRAAYYYNGTWSLEPSPLNVTPGDNAGTGTGRPAVAAAGDGVAIVAWGEAGGIYTRRVWATAPSTVYERADGPIGGCTEQSADEAAIGSGGDSSYADVAFHEQLSCDGQATSRVLINRLRGSAYDGIKSADGLTGGSADGASNPEIAIGEYGQGIVTAQRTTSHDLFASTIGTNGGSVSPAFPVNGEPDTSAPVDVPGFAGLFSTFIVWQQDPGQTGLPEIRLRYGPGQQSLGPETVISSPSQGPVDAPAGLAAGGDANGEVAAVWVQGQPGDLAIVAAQLYQPPGGFALVSSRHYYRQARPTLSWTAPSGAWGPLRYTVSVDGAAVGQTAGTSLRVPTPLSDGPHTYQVTATNPAGQQSQTGQASLFVDTTAPVARVVVSGRHAVGSRLQARLDYHDPPPSGSPASDASGVAAVKLAWGDGARVTIRPGDHRSFHTYARPGTYTLSLVVLDRAGNRTRVILKLHIVKPKATPPRSGH